MTGLTFLGKSLFICFPALVWLFGLCTNYEAGAKRWLAQHMVWKQGQTASWALSKGENPSPLSFSNVIIYVNPCLLYIRFAYLLNKSSTPLIAK